MTLQTVALYAALAALVAGLGPPLATTLKPGDFRVGMADALAAGTMLGVAYPLIRDALDAANVAATAGGVVAVLVLLAIHVFFDIDGVEAPSARSAFLAGSVHSAPEGLALGVAFASSPQFGVVVAMTLALHNAGEGIALGTRLPPHVTTGGRVAVAALANTPQVALGITGYLACVANPSWRPALAGASAGALIYLALADLLPDGYRAAGRTAISVAVIAATSIVAFVGAL